MFDYVIFSVWPRGLYLAKLLSERGKKTAYVEILPRLKTPLACFLHEDFQEEKTFLNNLGFLFQQEGGFCLLNPKGIWPLQEMKDMSDRHPVLNKIWHTDSFKNFKDHWLTYLSIHIGARVFEYNNSDFFTQGIDLFSDYFLFEPFVKKINLFQKDHSQITFCQSRLEEIFFDKKKSDFYLQKKLLKGQKYIWLSDLPCPALSQKYRPCWQWSCCYFKVDFGSYEETIAKHFVSIQNLFLPWLHDNFISVFQKDGQLEVWTKQTYGKTEKSFFKKIEQHLSALFPGVCFSLLEKQPAKSFFIYSPESFCKLENEDLKEKLYLDSFKEFPRGDLVSHVRLEKQWFESSLFL